MKQTLKSWEIVERLHDELEEAVAEEEWAVLIPLANQLLRRALIYALKKRGINERRVLRLMLKHMQQLALSRDYYDLFEEVSDRYKDEVYFEEDEEEFDVDELERIAGECSDFFAEIRAMAVAAGDAS